MTQPEILSAAYKLIDWINFYWNFYIAFSAAVIGWVFASKGRWGTPQRLVVSALYLGFVGTSFMALKGTYLALAEVVELLCEQPLLCTPHLDLPPMLLERLKPDGWRTMLGLHVAGDTLVVLTIWLFSKSKVQLSNQPLQTDRAESSAYPVA